MKEHLQTLDTLNINLGSGDMVLVNFILAFVMFGVALSIRVSTFKSILKKPKSVTIGLLLQWFALPALTCLLAIALNPIITPMVALGMILVASCPGGNISNFLSSLSKGNVELSVSMTAITTLFASIITPFNFWFWGTHYCRFASLKNQIPTLEIPFDEMLSQIFLILGVPIVLGLLFSHKFPNVAKKIIKPTQILSILFFVAMVLVSMTQVLSGFEQRWEVYAAILCALVVVVIHNTSALATGFYGGRIAKLPTKDCRTLAIEIGIQNSGLALALLFNP
jgi:BASS family bile acid:Na+ symporter